MITRLSGTLVEFELTEAVIDVNGVGYSVSIPMSTCDKLPNMGEKVVLHTWLHVREDAMQLFGFYTKDERKLFQLVTTVSGIGPKLALNVLSCMSVNDFSRALISGDVKALTKISGIGKRVAERLIVELREKIQNLDIDLEDTSHASPGTSKLSPASRDAIAALETLGFKREKAKSVVESVLSEAGSESMQAQALIRKALQILNS